MYVNEIILILICKKANAHTTIPPQNGKSKMCITNSNRFRLIFVFVVVVFSCGLLLTLLLILHASIFFTFLPDVWP